jgi:hypothetical protein
MSFLDNLESNLEALESREEADNQREHQARVTARQQALATAPWADKLKNSPFTQDLLRQTTRLGYSVRVKVRMTWIGSTLRLEAGEKRLELRPAADGVAVVFLENTQETKSTTIDLTGSAEALAREWLTPAA